MTASSEEIETGRKAFRLIEAYNKRRQRSVGAYLRDAVMALLVAYGLFLLGAGWIALGAMLLWLFPRIATDYLLKRQFVKDLKIIEDLRKKYGTAIDSKLE